MQRIRKISNGVKVVSAMAIILSLVGIVFFGFALMNHSGEMGHTGCFASIASGIDCPQIVSLSSFLIFHINFLKNFSTATFGSNSITSFLLFLSLILLLVFILKKRHIHLLSSPLKLFLSFKRFLELKTTPFKEEIIAWLALHENSPSRI